MYSIKNKETGDAGFDWSANNDLIVSSSLDGTCRVWKVSDYSCLRIVQDSNNSQLLCCMFQPINNNLFIVSLAIVLLN
jgi:WD40 repeat protein